MKKTNVISLMILLVGLSMLPAVAQDDATINELNKIIEQIGNGGDPCQYMQRVKVLIKKLASENADMYNAMRPLLAELDKPDNSCDAPATPVKKATPPPAPAPAPPPPPPPPAVILPRGTAFALPPGAVPGRPLDGGASRDVVRQVNQARSSQRGVNQLPLPAGDVTVQGTGNFSLEASGGRRFEVRRTGALASVEAPGGSARVRANGRIASVSLDSVNISHGPHGENIVTTRRSDQTLLVSAGAGHGYLQENLTRQGRAYVRRTYVNGTQRTTRLYAMSTVSGSEAATYIPPVAYAPAFYDWVNGSWDSARPKSWPWIADQVVRQFASYFTPDANYVNPVQWLTDFVVARALRASPINAPEAVDDGEGAPADTAVSPDLKKEIADQLRADIAIEKTAAISANPPETADPSDGFDRVYVVGTGMEVTSSTDDACWLSAGDILRFDGATSGTTRVSLRVASSRIADCVVGATISIEAADLREMHNELRAGLDEGLTTLRAKQGTAGWPTAPENAVAPPPRPTMTGLPPVNANAAALLEAQQRESADKEKSFVQSVFAGGGQ